MAFTIMNETDGPIHMRISNAGLTKYGKNWIEARQGHTFQYGHDTPAQDGLGAVWYDISAYYATDENEVHVDDDNRAQGLAIMGTVLAVLGTIGGIAMMVIPGAQPAAVALTGVSIAALQTGTATFAIVSGISTVVGVAGTAVAAEVGPAALTGMYGPDNYSITVRGGHKIVSNPQGGHTITHVDPIVMEWHNDTRDTHGKISGSINKKRVYPKGTLNVSLPYK
jgi:hypothetical protein